MFVHRLPHPRVLERRLSTNDQLSFVPAEGMQDLLFWLPAPDHMLLPRHHYTSARIICDGLPRCMDESLLLNFVSRRPTAASPANICTRFAFPADPAVLMLIAAARNHMLLGALCLCAPLLRMIAAFGEQLSLSREQFEQ